jgi:pSer/pThr/pTyr-binding forkhead associated (FHA) protein
MSDVVRLVLQVLVVLALYSFLGGLLFVLWRDLRDARSAHQIGDRAFLLIHLAGGGSMTRRLEAVNLIGRAGDNGIVIDDETVSNRHARLSYMEARWWLEDLGSKNGTQLNEVPIEGPMVMTSGDRIRMGAVEMTFQVGDGGPTQSSRDEA